MSKKRFSDGLDDLFTNAAEEEAAVLSSGGFGSEAAAANPRPDAARKAHGKNFLSDLDALLQEAWNEGMDRHDASQSEAMSAGSKTKSEQAAAALRPAHSGLDALIRQTVDIQELLADEPGVRRRLTIAVDKTKVEQLKTIARLENAYLKDLLAGVIDEYIREYTQQKGLEAI